VDISHPNIKDSVFYNTKESLSFPPQDWDSNGYFNDVNGYDFDKDRNLFDDELGDGTYASGIILSVNPKAKILPLKVLNTNNQGDGLNVYKAIRYAIMMGAPIISITEAAFEALRADPELLEESFFFLQYYKVLFIVPAGDLNLNLNKSQFQLKTEWQDLMIRVCSVDYQKNLSKSSNYGVEAVDLCASGENIKSTSVAYKRGELYEYRSGTAVSSAIVAGAASLLLSINPNLQNHQLKNLLIKTSEKVQNPPEGVSSSNGTLNINNAVSSANKSWMDIIKNLIPFNF